MSKFVVGLSLSICTFIISVGFSLFWNYGILEDHGTVPKLVTSPDVFESTACELIEQPQFFEGKSVRFEATAFVSGFGKITLYPKECFIKPYTFNDHKFRDLRLDVSELNASDRSLSSSVDRIKRLSVGKDKEVDVVIFGLVSKTREIDGWIETNVMPSKIEFISPERDLIPKGGG